MDPSAEPLFDGWMVGSGFIIMVKVKEKVLGYAEKSSVIWTEPNCTSSVEEFGQTEHSFDSYLAQIENLVSSDGEQNTIGKF